MISISLWYKCIYYIRTFIASTSVAAANSDSLSTTLNLYSISEVSRIYRANVKVGIDTWQTWISKGLLVFLLKKIMSKSINLLTTDSWLTI